MDNENWILKKNDGNIYGPVSTKNLQQWILQRRVMANDLISKEGELMYYIL